MKYKQYGQLEDLCNPIPKLAAETSNTKFIMPNSVIYKEDGVVYYTSEKKKKEDVVHILDQQDADSYRYYAENYKGNNTESNSKQTKENYTPINCKYCAGKTPIIEGEFDVIKPTPGV